jgi:transcriptional regulator with XRE-family HTH domain
MLYEHCHRIVTRSGKPMKPPQHKNVTGPRIRAARRGQQPRLSQAALAKGVAKYGVRLDQAALSRIESRSRNVADYELVAIARRLGVTVDALCGLAPGREGAIERG